jgi:thiol-disulfide isomerase/thioredoxin
MYLRNIGRIVLPLVIAGTLCVCHPPAAAAAERAPSFFLHLTNGDSVSGELRGSEDANVLHWSSPFFAKPLEFPLMAVRSVHRAAAGPQPKPAGDYGFELANGDLLYGHLLGITEEDVELDSAPLGRVLLRREQLQRFYPWNAADAIYNGPNGLAGWKEPAGKHHWHDEGGQLVTEQSGAALFGALGIPEKAMIEVELSWKRKPDFILALGVDDRDLALQHAFRFEVWDNELVAVGETSRDADEAPVQEIGMGEGRARIRTYLDQKQGRLVLLSRNGKPAATLHIHVKNPRIRSGLCLKNTKGDVRLEQVRITRWNGLAPRDVDEEKPRIVRKDGSVVYGRLADYDPKAKRFTLRDGATETVVGQEAIAEVVLSPSATDAKPSTGTADGTTLGVLCRDGSRLTGRLMRLEDTHLTLTCPGAKEPLRLPVADLRSMTVLQSGQGPRPEPVAGRPGRLEMEGVHLKGKLVQGDPQPGASCLLWHPDLGLNASPLVHGLSGRIVYREPPQPRPATPQFRGPMVRQAGGVVIQQMGRRGVVIRRMVGPNGRIIQQQIVAAPGPYNAPQGHGGNLTQLPFTGKRSLQLRSGEVISGEVIRMDEKGVLFKTPYSNAILVAHDKIKAVELIAMHHSPWLDQSKRDRLLTLPRMQKDSPPTHLICSKNGDFLRGRIIEMDETRLKVEVRLATREIPRDRVAQIIWLHPDELTGRKIEAAPVHHDAADRVQAVRADGNRLTFVAEKADQKTVSGTSEFLGPCRVELAEVDLLLFGTFIEEAAEKLPTHPWKLHNAPEPKFAQAGSGASSDGLASGIESPLVGQPAFSFRLDLLDGRSFHLAEHRGRVVVLDFWATWCGPCMQTMPLIDEVVREFSGRGVELLAVNLEEQPQQVKSTLERHKLQIPVALDREGAVAAKYAVTAIPQTVVIDREGKIARLFVGGGKKTAEALRKALAELSAPSGERGASAP